MRAKPLSVGRVVFFFENLLIFGCPGSSLLSRLSLVSANRGYSPVAVHGLLLVAASPAAERRLWDARAAAVAACELRSWGPQGDQYSHK